VPATLNAKPVMGVTKGMTMESTAEISGLIKINASG
jgi:hypothetical protein